MSFWGGGEAQIEFIKEKWSGQVWTGWNVIRSQSDVFYLFFERYAEKELDHPHFAVSSCRRNVVSNKYQICFYFRGYVLSCLLCLQF